MSEIDLNVCEPSGALLKLRDDLICAPRMFNDQPGYLIEDPLRGKFYRVGLPEFTLMATFDGRTTLIAGLARVAQQLGRDALDEQDGLAIVSWLMATQLAHTSQSTQATPLLRAADRQAQSRWKSRLNPFGFQIRLLDPDRLLTRLLPYVSWMLTPLFAAFWLAAVVAGGYCVVADWDHFVAASIGILDPSNWLRMAVAWLLLKMIHESFHALVCKKYGGEVHHAGVMFLFFAPLAYVDVTSSWRFRSKWQRMAVAAAGMWIEVLISALALVAWSQTGPGVLHRWLQDVALMAGITTLAFNANPLMRFDGYYILSDWLEVPNLYAVAQRTFVQSLQRRCLGWNLPAMEFSPWLARLLAAYGLAAFVWRVAMCLSLALLLIGWLDGLGVVLAITLCSSWFLLPGCAALKSFRKAMRGQQTHRGRAVVFASGVLALMALTVAVLTMPAHIVSPAVVEYSPRCIVRAGSPGFVRDIRVQSGQWVAAGDVIAELQNDDLELERAGLTAAVEQARIKTRIAFQNDDLNKYQIEIANRQALEKKLAEAQQQIARLTIRATEPGQVIARNLTNLQGKYLHAGEQLAVIGGHSKQLVIAVAQDDLDACGAPGAAAVDVRIRGESGGWQAAGELKVEPRASLQPPHEALSARVGGPLVVKQTSVAATASEDRKLSFELIRPVFTAVVPLSGELATNAHAGEWADVRFQAESQTVAARLFQRVTGWFREQVAHAQHRAA